MDNPNGQTADYWQVPLKSWTRLDWLIILIFAVLVSLFHWQIITPNLADRQSFPPGDFYAQFWAFTTFDAGQLSAGRLPLWNPYTFAGAPFWADVQAAVFYPFSSLTLLLSAPRGFSAFVLELEAIIHFWLAATFMYLFIREITGHRGAAVIAALTFTFGGYLTGYPSQQLAVLEADVWLPLILFFLYRANKQTMNDESRRMNNKQITIHHSREAFCIHAFKYLVLAGVAWGMVLLAGHPQSAFIIACVSIAYFLFLWLGAGSRATGSREQGRQGAEEQSRTHHAIRNTQYEIRTPALRAGASVTHHASRITLLHLSIFLLTGLALAAIQFIPAMEYTLLSVRSAGTYDKMSGGFPITDLIQVLLPGQVSLYSPLYVGVVGIILAVWAVFAAPNRHTIFWGVVAVITLLITFGGNTFLYSPLYLYVPGFSIFRGQERWAFATAFSLCVLAGYGFKQLAISNYQLTKNTFHVSSLTKYLFFFALLLTLAFFYGLNDSGWAADSLFYGLLGASTLLTVLAALAWLLWKFTPRLPAPAFATLTAALICFDLFSVNWQTNLYPQPPEWHTRMPAAVQAIKADAAQSPDEPYRVYNEFRLYDNYGVPFKVEDLWGASPLRPTRYDEFLAPPMPIERTWELLNVKYVITWRQELFTPSTIIHQEPAADGTTYVHRLDSVGPRAWLVNQVKIIDDDTILQTLTDPGFDRWNIALLEENSEWTNSRMDEFTDGEIQNSQFPASGRLIHQVSTDSPALLVLSETHYPGWQATIDGDSVPILRADYVLRAVPVPAGEHTVELTFQPRSFTIGAIISGLAVLVIAVVLILSYRPSRHRTN